MLEIYLHLDNDEIGRSASKSLQQVLSKKYKVYEEFTKDKTSKLIEKLIKLHEDNCNEILSMLKENNNEW